MIKTAWKCTRHFMIVHNIAMRRIAYKTIIYSFNNVIFLYFSCYFTNAITLSESSSWCCKIFNTQISNCDTFEDSASNKQGGTLPASHIAHLPVPLLFCVFYVAIINLYLRSWIYAECIVCECRHVTRKNS